MRRSAPILVLGTLEDRPPGIDAVGDVRYAATEEELATSLPGTEVVFAWDFDRGALAASWVHAADVRWVQASSAGVDGLLFPDLVESEVVVTNARGVFDDAMAEYVLGLLIAHNRDLRTTLEHGREGVWRHRDTRPLVGQRLLVVGPGPIGRAIARLARAVGMRVSAVGRRARAGDSEFDEVRGVDELLEALPGADHVVVAIPYTETTRGLIGRDAFAAMTSSAHFVNVGRGAVVDEDALVEALRSGGIAAASLDVFAEEPLPADHPLWGMPNVVVSPHMSGDFPGWERAVVEVFLDNLERWRRREPLRNIVDKSAGHAGTVVEPR